MTQAPSHLSTALDEETARAELYGLIAELFYAPPTPALLAQLRVAATQAPSAGGFLEEPWRNLVGTAREMDDSAIVREIQKKGKDARSTLPKRTKRLCF